MTTKTVKLEELCTIRTGAPTSRAKKVVDDVEPREVKVLLPRAMQNGTIIDEDIPIEAIGEVKDESFTRENDVIIKLSTPYDSVYIDKAHEGIMVPSSSMVLRQKEGTELNMRYLSMFLNLPQTNSVLQAVSTGQSAAMALLKRHTVANLEIPLIPLERQQRLANLGQAIQERKEQYMQLIKLDKELTIAQMTKSIWGMEEQR